MKTENMMSRGGSPVTGNYYSKSTQSDLVHQDA